MAAYSEDVLFGHPRGHCLVLPAMTEAPALAQEPATAPAGILAAADAGDRAEINIAEISIFEPPFKPPQTPKASFSFTPNSAGTFAYHCTYHPWMKGTVTVQP